MNDMEHHGALVKQLFKERDELRDKLAAIEARLVDRTAEWKLALGQRDTQRTSANRLREVLLWIGGDPNILIGPQATNILEIWKRARAVLLETSDEHK